MEKIRKVQLKKINKMLLEMASGNFFYRLERSDNQDNIQAMVLILNMLAEEIQEALIHQGHANAHGRVKYTIQMNFLLNHLGSIEMVNKHTCMALSYHLKDFIGRPFEDFLNGPSKECWQNVQQKLKSKGFYDTSLDLTFTTNEGLSVPCTAHITTCKGNHSSEHKTMVTVIHYTKELDEHEKAQRRNVISFKEKADRTIKAPTKNRPKLSFDDIRKIREGRNLIMNNLENDLPSLKEFAHQLGTNEFKLKYGFKELYGTSVYRFLLQERLRKAKMLIQYTDHPIKTVAYKTGFKSIPHFSRVFKKTYGYTPSALRKSLQNST